MKTFFASPERSSEEVVKGQFEQINKFADLTQLFNALPYIVTILNKDRQIVFSNKVLIDTLKAQDLRDFLGKRPGEALNCVHSNEMEGGCGTSESCRYCGAVTTITQSMKEKRKVVNECRITSVNDGVEEYLDFEVSASPFLWEDEYYTIFTVADISGVKRKRMLERIFFHDILNTAGNMRGISDLVKSMDNSAPRKEELLNVLYKMSAELVEEIQDQKQLSAAESGDLIIAPALVNSREIMETLVAQFKSHIKKAINIIVSEDSEELGFSSDKGLLTRILKNMLKNAIEASEDGDTVEISASLTDKSIKFKVHNPRFIPRNIQLQIFKRSFSTKGTDRGLGTYSMKLLGEHFLKGKVYFSSDEKAGTDFYFEHPLT